MSENIVDWLLETIKTEWPEDDDGEDAWPDDVYRINRDEPYTLETDERTRSIELSQAAAIGASKGDSIEEAMGIDFNFSVEQPVDIRIEGLHEYEHGTIESDAAFNDLVDGVKEAIKRVRKHPSIDADPRYYHTITIESETNLDAENRDYYRRDLTIHFHGNEIRDD